MAIIGIGRGRAVADAGLGQHQFDAFGGVAVAGAIRRDRAQLSEQRWPQPVWPNALVKSADGIEARSGAASSDGNVRNHATLHVSSLRG